MKIGFLSDVHGESIKKFSLRDINIILLNGDFCKADLVRKYWMKYKLKGKDWKKELSEEKIKEAEDEIIESCIKILSSFGKKPVYFVSGNVEDDKYLKFKLKNNVHNINEKITEINSIRIAGVRYIREQWWIDKYAPDMYKSNEGSIRKFLEQLEAKVDILLCHNPPYGYLDINDNPKTPKMMGKHHGSKLILDYIKREQPRYCLCGHIHEAKGKTKIGETIVINGGLNKFKIIEL